MTQVGIGLEGLTGMKLSQILLRKEGPMDVESKSGGESPSKESYQSFGRSSYNRLKLQRLWLGIGLHSPQLGNPAKAIKFWTNFSGHFGLGL